MTTSHSISADTGATVPWLHYAIAPVLPFLLATGVMQFFAPSELAGAIGSLEIDRKSLAFAHLGDRLTYATAAFLQVATCAGVIYLHVRHLAQMNPAARHRAYRVMTVVILLAVVVLSTLWATRAAPFQLTYDTVRQVFLNSPGWPRAYAADGAEGIMFGQSRMLYGVMLPFLCGATVVALVAGAGAALARRDTSEGVDWESDFSRRVAQLQQSFRASSLVLVVTTVALMLFLQLPAGLLEDASAKSMTRYALGLTVFWGAVMTLTLFAVFLLPVLALRDEVTGHLRATKVKLSTNQWLSERGHLSVKRQLTNLATMLAPVMVGPLGTLLQSALGG